MIADTPPTPVSHGGQVSTFPEPSSCGLFPGQKLWAHPKATETKRRSHGALELCRVPCLLD